MCILYHNNTYKVCVIFFYMSKARLNLTVESALLERAKSSGLNLSAELEKVLRAREIKKSDLPEKALIIRCSICKKEITEGFLCRERELVLCQECQDSFDMSKCPHDKRGEHMHIKWPGFDNLNVKFLVDVKNIGGT